MGIEELIHKIPAGYSEAIIDGKKYGVTRSDFNQGKSLKVFAEELGGNDFVSFNFYKTATQVLKPCEMPQDKVLDFLRKYSQ